MVLAREAFADTPEGRESLEKACDRILMDRGIDRDDFEAYTGKLAADDKRRTRIQNRILERVDQLQALEVTAGVSPTPRAPSARR
jgi:hypothetical protein